MIYIVMRKCDLLSQKEYDRAVTIMEMKNKDGRCLHSARRLRQLETILSSSGAALTTRVRTETVRCGIWTFYCG